jgi:hypothetical protein
MQVPGRAPEKRENQSSGSHLKSLAVFAAVIVSIFLVAACFLWVLLWWVTQPAAPAANPTAASIEVILDVPALLDKSLGEIRGAYEVAPYEELHALSGYEDILPASTSSEGYTEGDNTFYVFYNAGQDAIGFQIYEGLEPRHLRLGDWSSILPLLDLDVTQAPADISDSRAVWDRVSDHHIEIIRRLSGEYAFAVLVVERR